MSNDEFVRMLEQLIWPGGRRNDEQFALALRPRFAAKALSVSPRTLWEWTRAGIVPCVRIGKGKRQTVLYSVADLQTWLTKQAESVKGGDHDPR